MSTARPRRRLLAAIGALLAVAVLVSACSIGGTSSGISVTGAWVRPGQTGATDAAYFVFDNTGSASDTLLSVSSPVATTVEIHETVDMSSAMPDASGAMPSTGSGMMGMQKIDSLELSAGTRVEFKPGSYHVMLIGLTRDLKVGDKVELTLTFENAGEVKVTAEVRES